jgi:hypothetical protein
VPKFSVHVALMSPEYKPASFAPGDEVPEWAIGQVGDHVLEPEDAAESDGADDQDDAPDPDADGDTDGDDADAPPADDQPDFTAAAPARRGRARKQ